MFSKPASKGNPWDEDARDRAKASRAIVLNSKTQAEALLPQLTAIQAEMEVFIEDLDFIQQAYAKKPDVFRHNRPLTAVHLPGIIGSLTAIADLRANGGDEARAETLSKEVAKCFSAASQARSVIQSQATTAIEIEAAVLNASIRRDPALPDSQKSAPLGLDGVTKVGRKAIANGLFAGKKFTSIGNGAMQRAGAGTSAAKGYISGLIEDGVNVVTSPIAHRVSALRNVLVSTSMSALGAGFLTAVIFPPAVPFAVGLAVLGTASQFPDAVKNAQNASQKDQVAKRALRDEEMQRHLNKLRGRSPIVRMETPHVHVAMNTETGQCQGIILTGRHAGESMAEIGTQSLSCLADTAPDEQTKEIIKTWIERFSGDDKQQESKRSKNAPDVLSFGVDLLTAAAL